MTIAPPLTEAAFMDQVTQYAELCGWEWVHCRAGRTVDSWRTPMSGTMAKGWPDLVLCREHDRRLIFAELKRDAGKVTADQERVLAVLGRLRSPVWTVRDSQGRTRDMTTNGATIDVITWRPRDWAAIVEALQ